MTLEDAISEACSSVGIVPPKARAYGRWVPTEALGKKGKGDGRVMLGDERVTAYNWKTGETKTVWLNGQRSVEDRRRFAEHRQKDREDERQRHADAARLAKDIVASAKLATHPYLGRKRLAGEKVLVVGKDVLASLGANYLIGGGVAIVVPARIGDRISTIQLIWEDGTKKFLYGGATGGACHRIATGNGATWLCEGFATGLSLRIALKGLSRSDGVFVCFSASNIVKVAAAMRGPRFVAADFDAPPEKAPQQFGGLGAGEYFARQTGVPYVMPTRLGEDFNDMLVGEGVFEVQRLLSTFLREAKV